jgi:hypothetical protein
LQNALMNSLDAVGIFNLILPIAWMIGSLGILFGSSCWQSQNCRNRLNAWAKSEHLTLLEVRYVWRFQGPNAWSRSQYQTMYRVKVWDAQGQILHGWVTLGTYWGVLTWFNPPVSDVRN